MALPARVFVRHSASRRQERSMVGHDAEIDVGRARTVTGLAAYTLLRLERPREEGVRVLGTGGVTQQAAIV